MSITWSLCDADDSHGRVALALGAHAADEIRDEHDDDEQRQTRTDNDRHQVGRVRVAVGLALHTCNASLVIIRM